MTAAHRARISGPLSVIALTILLSGCATRLSDLATGRTFMQGLAAGGVVEEGDVSVLPASAELSGDGSGEDEKVKPIETVPGKTYVAGPDGELIETDAEQTSFIEMEGDLFAAADKDQPAEQRKLPDDDMETTAYMRNGPSVQGQRLNLRPGQTATGKALELLDELKDSKSREDELAARVAELEAEIKRKDDRIIQAIREMNATRNELIAVQGQLEDWAAMIEELREAIKQTQDENLGTMQLIIELLQQFLQVEADMQIQDATPLRLEDLVPEQP